MQGKRLEAVTMAKHGHRICLVGRQLIRGGQSVALCETVTSCNPAREKALGTQGKGLEAVGIVKHGHRLSLILKLW